MAQSTSSHSDLARLPALDGLRGIAIIWVIYHNALVIELPDGSHWLRQPLTWPIHLVDHLVQTGWAGVQLFFVLSGFLITRILLATRGSASGIRDFFLRRVLRIFPLYFISLAAILVVLAHSPWAPDKLVATQQHQLALWIFLCNWVQPFGLTVFGLSHFWSLAVEEQFYLLWPFVVRRVRTRTLLWCAAGLCGLALVIRLALMMRGVDREVTYQFTFCRMDGLLAGAIVAIAFHLPRLREAIEIRRAWLLPAALVVVLAGAVPTRGYELGEMATQTIGYSALAAGFALIIARLSADQGRGTPQLLGFLDTGLLRSVGTYSYAMYIVHYPLDRYMFRPMLVHHFGEIAPAHMEVLYGTLLVILSYGLGYLSYTVLERRFLRLGTSSVQAHSLVMQDRVRPAR